MGQPVSRKVHFLELGQGPESIFLNVGDEIVRQIQMPESVQIRASKRTGCEIPDLIAIHLEPGQGPGVSEPGPSQGVQSVVAQHQHLQAVQPAEGVVSQGGAGDAVLPQQQRPQLGQPVQGVVLDALDGVSAQGEQSQIR